MFNGRADGGLSRGTWEEGRRLLLPKPLPCFRKCVQVVKTRNLRRILTSNVNINSKAFQEEGAVLNSSKILNSQFFAGFAF